MSQQDSMEEIRALETWIENVRSKFKLPKNEDGGDYWSGYAGAVNDLERFVYRRRQRLINDALPSPGYLGVTGPSAGYGSE